MRSRFDSDVRTRDSYLNQVQPGARKAEKEDNRRKLFPIRLVDFNVIQKWECFDVDSGKDLAIELREYFI